jgi:hypothetical protein
MGNARGGRGAAKPGKGILRTTGHSLNSQEASQPYSQNLPLTQGMSQVCPQNHYLFAFHYSLWMVSTKLYSLLMAVYINKNKPILNQNFLQFHIGETVILFL